MPDPFNKTLSSYLNNWRGSGILSQSSEGGRYAFNIGLEIKILGIFHYSILFQHHQELDIKGGAKK